MRANAGIHDSFIRREDVDGRDKHGHDGLKEKGRAAGKSKRDCSK
jgi:hypothetical protein